MTRGFRGRILNHEIHEKHEKVRGADAHAGDLGIMTAPSDRSDKAGLEPAHGCSGEARRLCRAGKHCISTGRRKGWVITADADAYASRRCANYRPLRMSTDEYGWLRSKRGWNRQTTVCGVGTHIHRYAGSDNAISVLIRTYPFPSVLPGGASIGRPRARQRARKQPFADPRPPHKCADFAVGISEKA